jgi:CheY-like chemotaxis protein
VIDTRVKRILVVDDDPDIRETITELLQEEGYVVTAAAHGGEALSALRADPTVGLILLDLMMPIMDGWQFRNEQRQDRPFLWCSFPRRAGMTWCWRSELPSS